MALGDRGSLGFLACWLYEWHGVSRGGMQGLVGYLKFVKNLL